MVKMVPENSNGVDHTDEIVPAIFIIMNICVITGNSFILFVVIIHRTTIRHQRRNRAAHLLTINLCIADLFLGLIGIYYILSMYVHEIKTHLSYHEVPCIITVSSIITAHMASGFNLVAIAVERYIYVVHALRYRELMTSRRLSFMIAFVWCLAILGTSPLYYWNKWYSGVSCRHVFIIPRTYTMIATVGRLVFIIIIITIFHYRVHHKAQTVQKRTDSLSTATTLRTRTARVVVFIFCIYVASWSPFVIMFMCKRFDVYVPLTFFKFSECFIFINVLVNPFIYAFNNRIIRNVIMKTLHMCKKKISISRISIITERDVENTGNRDTSTNTGIKNEFPGSSE